jgi:elongation factor P--(R)-beta-lysine ligase
MQLKLQLRAQILEQIRHFFASRKVLEVETPLLYPSTIPSPNIHSFTSDYNFCSTKKTLYLQTSPEFAMKRLLAEGCGDIYQICKAFRNEEQGRLHNHEFTILEWYRIGYDHHKLMNEMDELLQFILNTKSAERFSYQEIFLQYLEIDPLAADITTLQTCAAKHGLNFQDLTTIDKDDWLQLLLNHCIEPHLGKHSSPTFIYGFPATQAALAKINADDMRVANRFEVYIDGIELANGFHELNDAEEQRQRFNTELQIRQELGLPTIPIDEAFLKALPNLPACAGVALGIDRLLLIAAKTSTLADVLSISI